MTKVAKEALSPEQVAELPRVYLMPAEEVAAFQESLMVASEASDRGIGTRSWRHCGASSRTPTGRSRTARS